MIIPSKIYPEIEEIWTVQTIGKQKFFSPKSFSTILKRFKELEPKDLSPTWSNILNLMEIAIRNYEVLQTLFIKLEATNKQML
jgi:hypothetical protein